MRRSKLIEVLSALDKNELKEFGVFLAGTSVQRITGTLWLFKYLKKYHPEFPETKLDKKLIVKKMSTCIKVSEHSIANFMSNLYNALEEFLILKDIQANKVEKDFAILRVLRKKKLDKLFFQKIGQVEKDWEQNKPQGIAQLYNEYKLNMLCMTHPSYYINPKSPIGPETLLIKLDLHYIALKLYWTLAVYSRSYILTDSNKEQAYPHYLLQEVNNLSNEPRFQANPYITIFQNLLTAYKEDTFENYAIIKQIFIENLEVFTEMEVADLLKLLHNYCVVSYKKGKTEYAKELFLLYQLGINKGLYIENGYISPDIFRNIVRLSCSIGELEWTENFIQTQARYLNEEHKDDTLALCKAMLKFSEKDFEQVIDILLQTNFANELHGLSIKALQLRAYYELEDMEDSFFNLVKSFRSFIHRSHNVSDNMKQTYLQFIHYINKLQLIRYQDKQKFLSLKKEIDTHYNIGHKSWLLNKVNELIQSKSPVYKEHV